MSNIISISTSPEFDELRKKYNLSWSEAARIGMGILLSELELRPYDNELNLVRKMKAYKDMTEELSLKIVELEKKNDKHEN